MTKFKFKVGDKVTIRSWDDMKKEYGTDCAGDIPVPCIFNRQMKEYCGKKMIISYIRPHHLEDRFVYFLEGAEKWRFSEEMFEEFKKPLIVIYRKDNEVIALDKSTGKMNKAICSPEDKFDFYTGASLAITRLVNNEPVPVLKKVREYYNGEIVCISTDAANLTKGKIYKVKNGMFRDDSGRVHGCVYPYVSFKDLNDQHLSEFVEVVR